MASQEGQLELGAKSSQTVGGREYLCASLKMGAVVNGDYTRVSVADLVLTLGTEIGRTQGDWNIES